MELIKFKCSSCGSTQYEKVTNGYKCKYCGNIQDVIFKEEPKKMTSVSHAKHRQIREIGEIRVRIKQRKIHVKKYSGYYFPSVSGPTANLVVKKIIRGQKRYAYCDNSL